MLYKLFEIESDKNIPLETTLVFGGINVKGNWKGSIQRSPFHLTNIDEYVWATLWLKVIKRKALPKEHCDFPFIFAHIHFSLSL